MPEIIFSIDQIDTQSIDQSVHKSQEIVIRN